MDKETIVLYNPANAKNLTEKQIAAIAAFTDEDLKQLAAAYPNSASMINYLVLQNMNLPKEKQTYQLSTYANLYSLRSRHHRHEFVPISFRTIFKFPGVRNLHQPTQQIAKKKVQDLTLEERKSAEGVKVVAANDKGKQNIPKAEPTEAKPVITEPESEPIQPSIKRASKKAAKEQLYEPEQSGSTSEPETNTGVSFANDANLDEDGNINEA